MSTAYNMALIMTLVFTYFDLFELLAVETLARGSGSGRRGSDIFPTLGDQVLYLDAKIRF